MKKISLLLLLAIFSISGFSQNQQIKILSFTVKNTLPESVDSWLTTPGALIMTAQKLPGTQVRELLMVVQLTSVAVRSAVLKTRTSNGFTGLALAIELPQMTDEPLLICTTIRSSLTCVPGNF